MSKLSRRKLVTTGLSAAAGAAGLGVAARLAQRYGLIPPDGGGIFGPGYPAHDDHAHVDIRTTIAWDADACAGW